MKKTPRIAITCMPEPGDDFSRYSAIINVSDAPGRTFDGLSIPAYWFPVHETGLWGYEPFWAVAKTLDHLAFRDLAKPVLIHCHAGANRSPSVAYAVMASNDVPDEWLDKFDVHGGALGLREIYERNLMSGRVYRDTIAVLRTRHFFPDSTLMGVLKEAGSAHIVYNRHQ